MKPQLVQGTRDFSPAEVLKRQYIFDTLRRIFVKYGFQPIETPSMEMLSTLMGKYGDEGDQLLYKILNNGDFLNSKDVQNESKPEEYAQILADRDSAKMLRLIAKRGLRYDLTVPFARYVVMNRNDIAFPFKRYQIQPVWRGDSPQKGRYREFYQCDIDVIGSDSLLYEAELMQVYDEAFAALNLEVIIRLNNRKILEGMAFYAGFAEKFVDITVAIDKLDKIGWDGVKRELLAKEISEEGFDKIKQFIEAKTLEELKAFFSEDNLVGLKGIEELETVLAYLEAYTFKNKFVLDFTLARGLGYYTGCIVEVEVDKKAAGQESIKMGSIGGGGRYDNLTGVFGWEGNSGVGISFGADRIYDVLLSLNRFEHIPNDSTQLFFMAFDDAAQRYAFRMVQLARAAGINTDIYPEPAKFNKQMKYANKRGLSHVVIVGEQEMETGLLTLKDMVAGTQENLSIEAIIEKFRN